MSERSARWVLFAAFVVMLPVPIWILGPGWVPPVRLVLLGGVALVELLVETSRGVVVAVVAIFWIQALVYALGLWGMARLLSRGLSRWSPGARRVATLAAVAIGLGIAISLPVYETPYASDVARGNLLSVFR